MVKSKMAFDLAKTPHEGSTITTSLGISEERGKFISETSEQIFLKEDTLSGTLSGISKVCEDAKELAFSSFLLGKVLQEMEAKQRSFLAMMKQILEI